MDAFIYYIKLCLTSKYFNFHGRASRREFWSFYAFICIIGILAYVLIDEMKAAYDAEGGGGLYTLVMVLVGLVCLYLVVPLLSATIRRLHDTGKSGWWVLVSLVPSIGELILFIMCLSPSEPYDNRYGRFKPYHY